MYFVSLRAGGGTLAYMDQMGLPGAATPPPSYLRPSRTTPESFLWSGPLLLVVGVAVIVLSVFSYLQFTPVPLPVSVQVAPDKPTVLPKVGDPAVSAKVLPNGFDPRVQAPTTPSP